MNQKNTKNTIEEKSSKYDDNMPSEKGKIVNFPGIKEIRDWDMLLLSRYKPVYKPTGFPCTLCALGPCDMGHGRHGACGQTENVFAAREALIMAVTGTSAHVTHAKDIIERLIVEKGNDMMIDMGPRINIKAPVTRTVTGMNPKKIEDLLQITGYLESQVTKLLASTHFGGESDNLDIESKILHAGMLDIVAMETADIAQTVGDNLPAGRPKQDVKVPIGFSSLPKDLPLILCIGHNSDAGNKIVKIINDRNLGEEIIVAGLCCSAHDMARSHKHEKGGPRIIGNIRDQLSFIRSGRADVIIIDQQCIRHDTLEETVKADALFIATSEQTCAGLPDLTNITTEEILNRFEKEGIRGAFISDSEKAAEAAIRLTYYKNSKIKSNMNNKVNPDTWEKVFRCNGCGLCTKHCPLKLPLYDIIYSAASEKYNDRENNTVNLKDKSISKRLLTSIVKIRDACLFCGKCDYVCPEDIKIFEMINSSAGIKNIKTIDGIMRIGRGPVEDYEIKSAGPSIILGEIPGVITFLTCPEYADGIDSIRTMAEILAKRGYIVLAAGCAAMDIGRTDINPYTQHSGIFDTGGVINMGSCVSSSHAIGALIKVASIFLHRKIDGNFKEIADYILNRIGSVGIMWGGITPKSFAAASGANRFGIPVVFGSYGKNFRRVLSGDSIMEIIDTRSGEYIKAGMSPPALFSVSESREECIVKAVRMCIRVNDTIPGRRIKLKNYIELSQTLLGKTPEDIKDLVRVPDDIPETWREALLQEIRRAGWTPSYIPDPTILPDMVRQ